MTELTLTLPYPPSVNHYKRAGKLLTTRSGKIYQPRVNTDMTKRYYYEVWAKIRKEGLKSFDSATIFVSLDVYPPDGRKRDLDGILKVCLDSMQRAGLYDDDYQIARLLVTRMSKIDQGQIVATIKTI